MSDKNLPTMDIKGHAYVMVKDRILAFNDNFPNGSIQTEIVSDLNSQTIIVKAIVTPDVKNPDRKFIDYSQAKIGQGWINTTSALENASTSAVGRALAYMGIGVIESIASADEVNKSLNAEKPEKEVWDREWVSEGVGGELTREATQEGCGHSDFWINKVKKEDSPNKGKQFKSCKSCKKFLGWYTAPEGQKYEEEIL